jgi:deazaflavin-dependent oxidoreductase (nitroreductase family)
MAEQNIHHIRETAIERFLNRAFGAALVLGIGRGHNRLLEVRGRKTGKVFSTPVNVLEHNGRHYLVASRGETQWARNARASGRVSLKKGLGRREYYVREVALAERAPLLKEFLDRFASSVQRFHEVPSGSPAESHAPYAARHPVFELIEVGRSAKS